jgi:hypothetical protein
VISAIAQPATMMPPDARSLPGAQLSIAAGAG